MPVGKVDGDALPVLAEEPEAVGVAGFVTLPECDPVGESDAVLVAVLDDVSVNETWNDIDVRGVIEIDTDADDVLLADSLPVIVDVDEPERDWRDDKEAVKENFDDTLRVAEIVALADILFDAVYVLLMEIVCTDVTVM